VVVACSVVVVSGTVVVVEQPQWCVVVVVTSGCVVVVHSQWYVVVVVTSGCVVVVAQSQFVVVVVACVVVVLQFDSRFTDAVAFAVKWSGHETFAVRTIVPVVPPGTVDVAVVVPPLPTGFAYPVTAYDWTPIAAVAFTIVICWFDSLFEIDQVTVCEPSEQLVWPDASEWCAKAGAESPTRAATITPATRPTRPARPRAIPRTRCTTVSQARVHRCPIGPIRAR
jgi:hypothetical protein